MNQFIIYMYHVFDLLSILKLALESTGQVMGTKPPCSEFRLWDKPPARHSLEGAEHTAQWHRVCPFCHTHLSQGKKLEKYLAVFCESIFLEYCLNLPVDSKYLTNSSISLIGRIISFN